MQTLTWLRLLRALAVIPRFDAIRWMEAGTVVAPSTVPEPSSALFILTGLLSLRAVALVRQNLRLR